MSHNWSRLHLDMTPRTLATLQEVEVGIAAKTHAETVRFCIHTMAQILAEAGPGGRLLVKRKDGTVVRIALSVPTK